MKILLKEESNLKDFNQQDLLVGKVTSQQESLIGP